MSELHLVTGGGGFIGSNLVHRLLREGKRVRVLDNFSTGQRANLRTAAKDIDMVEGDFTLYYTVQRAMRGVTHVYHQGALGSVPRSLADPIATTQANVIGSLNVFQACVEAKVERVVFASSSSVYGDTEELPKHEGMVLQPKSPYAVSKLAVEHYARVFHKNYGLPVIGLRYFNVFGPRQNPDSQYAAVIPKFIKAILKGEQLTIDGDGEQSRDFTYVDNVIHANLLAIHATGAALGKIVNIACNARYTLNFMIDCLEKFSGRSVERVYREPRAGDVAHSLASIELARATIDYEPIVSFTTGLEGTYRWFADND